MLGLKRTGLGINKVSKQASTIELQYCRGLRRMNGRIEDEGIVRQDSAERKGGLIERADGSIESGRGMVGWGPRMVEYHDWFGT